MMKMLQFSIIQFANPDLSSTLLLQKKHTILITYFNHAQRRFAHQTIGIMIISAYNNQKKKMTNCSIHRETRKVC